MNISIDFLIGFLCGALIGIGFTMYIYERKSRKLKEKSKELKEGDDDGKTN